MARPPTVRITKSRRVERLRLQLAGAYTKTGPSGPAKRILVVEDDRRLRELLSLALVGRGFRVDLTSDGREALAKLAGQPPYDVIVTDHQMPVMDGLSFVRELRARGCPSKIVVWSGALRLADATAYVGLKVEKTLTKTVQLSKVVDYLAFLCEFHGNMEPIATTHPPA